MLYFPSKTVSYSLPQGSAGTLQWKGLNLYDVAVLGSLRSPDFEGGRMFWGYEVWSLWVLSIKNWMGPYQRTPKKVTRAIKYPGLGVRGPWVLLEISWILFFSFFVKWEMLVLGIPILWNMILFSKMIKLRQIIHTRKNSRRPIFPQKLTCICGKLPLEN